MRPRDALLGIAAIALAVTAARCTSTSQGGGTGGGRYGSTGVGAGGSATVEACASCLDAKCKAEANACTDECFALQGCIDAVCFNLSVIGSSDEGPCQVYCLNLHPDGESAQLAYVNCAQEEPVVADAGKSCMPPCAGAPLDYDQCVAARTKGACATEASACAASKDCVAYEACASSCTSLDACTGCGQSTSGAAGEMLFEALQVCLAHGCFAEEWLPHY